MEHKESFAARQAPGIQQHAEAPQVHPDRSYPLSTALGLLTGKGGKGLSGGLVPGLLGKSMNWPGLGGAFPGMMGGNGMGGGFGGKWAPYPGMMPGGWPQQGAPMPASQPYAGWGAQQALAPALHPGWPANQAPPPNPGWGQQQAAPVPPSGWGQQLAASTPPPGWGQQLAAPVPPSGWGQQLAAPTPPPGWGQQQAAPTPPPGWGQQQAKPTVVGGLPVGMQPAGSFAAPPGLQPAPSAVPSPAFPVIPGIPGTQAGNAEAEEVDSAGIVGSNTVEIPGTTIVVTPEGTTEIPGGWQPSSGGPVPSWGPGTVFLGAPPAGLSQGGWPVGSGIPGLDPSLLQGLDEKKFEQLISAPNSDFMKQWENYEGWPFPGPPYTIVPDENPVNSAVLQSVSDESHPCTGNLNDPSCLQLCVKSLVAGWSEQQQYNVQLAAYVRQLAAQLQELESKPSYTIERIEYNFDQLKVEQLDGTLNIGMTAPSESQLQELGQLSLPANINVENGGAKVYPLPIPQSAAAGIASQAAKAQAASSAAAAKSAAQTPFQPAIPGAFTTPAQPGFGAAPGLTASQPPAVPAHPILDPGAAAIPGFSGTPAAPPQAASAAQPANGSPTGFPPIGASPAPGSAQPAVMLPGFTDIRDSVNTWLNANAHMKLDAAAKSSKVQLDPSHRQMVIEDVRRQIPERIRLYMNEELAGLGNSQGDSPEQTRLAPEKLHRTAERTVRDAETALKNYVQQLSSIAPPERKR
ncbi:hypothetical protein M3223_07850 [Paenibacillus pasadenensis]|uniref:spore germination protein GerPC n=1 Tax=Paenibacillus pasadenensis TaxID=217090 RepID=UPI00203FB519|nr:spore germination protein GerPC [Paenibacillus pasadenensis]MCM3747266.1 hypothetical protein [Paenibacillus pasadenensis]